MAYNRFAVNNSSNDGKVTRRKTVAFRRGKVFLECLHAGTNIYCCRIPVAYLASSYAQFKNGRIGLELLVLGDILKG